MGWGIQSSACRQWKRGEERFKPSCACRRTGQRLGRALSLPVGFRQALGLVVVAWLRGDKAGHHGQS